MRKKNRYSYEADGKAGYGMDYKAEDAPGGNGGYMPEEVSGGNGGYINMSENVDDTDEELLIDDLNDLAVQLQWARQSARQSARQGAWQDPRPSARQDLGRDAGQRARRGARKDAGQIAGRDAGQDAWQSIRQGSGRIAASGRGRERGKWKRWDYAAGKGQGDGNRGEKFPETAYGGMENAEDTGTISRVKRKNRKRRKRRAVFSAFLCLAVLAALTGCFFLALENRKLQDEVQVAMAYVEEVDSITTYTEEEVQKLTKEAAAEAAERSSMEKEKEILDDIRARMESGDGTAPMLRAIYKNELVVADDGRYYFFPVVDTLKHHSYQADQFKMNEEDILEYFADGNVVSKKGIDVSKYQGDIDWKKVAGDGVEYAFIRLGIRGSSEGKLVLDSTYEANIKGALKNDIDVGVYFFTQAVTKEEAVEEAEYVIEHLKGYDVSYPVVLDVEEVETGNPRTEGMTQQDWTDVCIAFCDRIRDAGYTPMIYGNLKTFLLMLDLEQLEEYEKWFAFYQTPLYFPYEFSIWQYSSTGSVDGIKGDVDMNVSMREWGS